jgi:SAM-dependent methyltransferase
MPNEHEHNRRAWNEVTPAHNSHKGDQAAYLRDGGSTLHQEEIELLGSLQGKELLHLQCNCGQDTLSLARLGARVTGVDISDEAVSFARTLSADSGIAAEFVRDDICQFLATTERRFDVAVATYGCLPWLRDLGPWGEGIHRVLRPKGRFVMVEYHPAALTFDEDWVSKFPYSSHGEARIDRGIPDYVGVSAEAGLSSNLEQGVKNFQGQCEIYEYSWGMNDILRALLTPGLNLVRFEEYSYCVGCRLFKNQEPREDGRWYSPAGSPDLPLMFGIVFEKKY